VHPFRFAVVRKAELIDAVAERIQLLGGISVVMAAGVAEMTTIPCPPRGREEVPAQISRLLEAHEIVIREVRKAAKASSENSDDGTNDLLVSSVLRTNEFQLWPGRASGRPSPCPRRPTAVGVNTGIA
jgi:starvation-inducible DNA-binding protein